MTLSIYDLLAILALNFIAFVTVVIFTALALKNSYTLHLLKILFDKLSCFISELNDESFKRRMEQLNKHKER